VVLGSPIFIQEFPTQIKDILGIVHSYRSTFKVLEKLPQDQEGFF
jgi:hypothetical protein